MAPGSAGTPRHTSIYHSDVDCPVIRTWIGQSPSAAQLVEVDRRSGQALAEWECPWLASGESREELDSDWSDYLSQQRFDLSGWRACLRCGSVAEQTIEVCSSCYLTNC